MRRPHSDRAGFTLIELLVVIAIIAILAAILFPVFAQARAKARQAVCLSNQKQIALAFQGYIQDYDETFPPADYGTTGQPDNVVWFQMIDPYIKSGVQGASKSQSKSVFVCPDIDVATADSRFAGEASKNPILSYAANRYLMPPYRAGGSSNPGPVNSLASVDAPAGLVLLAESLGDLPEVVGQDDAYGANIHYDRYMNARRRHSEGANFTFADGHVKWFKAPSDYKARSITGVVWQHCDAPSRFANASGWFAPLTGPLPATDSKCQ